MNYRQLVQPDLNQTGQAGYCLLLQYLVWNSPRPYDFAEDAWNHSVQHPGEAPPPVCVPVYWTFFDKQENFEFGHIAAWIPGRGVFSSPFDMKYGVQWFPSIQAVTDRINQIKGANARYLGWSEDLAGLKIIEGADMPASKDTADETTIRLAYNLAFDRDALPDDITARDGKQTEEQLLRDVLSSDEHGALVSKARSSDATLARATEAERQRDEVTRAVAIKENVIADLQSKLATQGADTTNLNAVGVALQWLIRRLGLTK